MQVNLACYQWLLVQKSDNIPINEKVIQEKSLDYARQLNINEFQASDHWLHTWKTVFFSRKCPSRNDKCMELNLSAYQDTSCTTYTTPMNSACSTKIFQRKPFILKGDKCSGGKDSKVLLTGMVSASGAGEKLPMFVISKLAKPRCFKNVKSLPCRYQLQEKS